MKKIISVNKDLEFRNNLAEVTSISLEHDLKLENGNISGDLLIAGSYKMNDTSINVENFDFKIPIDIEISERYNLDKLTIDIDDFFYEVIDNSSLKVAIDIALDNIEEIKEEIKEEVIEVKPFPMLEAEEDRMEVNDVKSLFDTFDESTETYATYKVCIVKEGDTIESILLKYNVTKELLEQYNDLSELKIGDKLIIPNAKS